MISSSSPGRGRWIRERSKSISAFLSSIDLFAAFNATYERIFATEPRPARTTTGAELPNILVEIDAVLYLPNGQPNG